MKNLLKKILLCTVVYFLNSLITLAAINLIPTLPVSMFKAKMIPCEKPSCECGNGYFYCKSDLLQKAIKHAFCTDNLSVAMDKMNCSCNFYYAQNNTPIKNGSYDIYSLFSLKELCNASRVKITVTLASDCYDEVKNQPELAFRLYKNIDQCELSKKFESRAFLHHYLMWKHEIPLTKISKKYDNGLQKLVAVVDASEIKCGETPLFAAVTYMDGGFYKRMHKLDPKIKVYAYLIEIEKLN